jgi:hypothetical protein
MQGDPECDGDFSINLMCRERAHKLTPWSLRWCKQWWSKLLVKSYLEIFVPNSNRRLSLYCGFNLPLVDLHFCVAGEVIKLFCLSCLHIDIHVLFFYELTFDGRGYGNEILLQVSGTEIFYLHFIKAFQSVSEMWIYRKVLYSCRFLSICE